MSAIASMARGARVSAVRIVVPTLYGRLPTTSARPPAGRASDVQSQARASAASTSTAGNAARTCSTSVRSTSSASTRPARRASSPVKAPCPGPISTARSAAVGATRSTIARAMPPSRRKCWPSAPRVVPRAGRGVPDRLHPLAPGGLGEDDRGQLLPVQRPVGSEDVTELPHDLGQRGLARRDDLARQLVGVDEDCAQARQDLGDRALAGGDAAGETDEQEAP